ncbi:MAG TPA: hypothetical protein VFK02_07740 [Kofleriaceae bacterium]|nr:hypothetical protein [Kofleriaceae bacterium]
MIPGELTWLFWDVDPTQVDLERHRDFVFERIMTRGDWFAMRWLIAHAPKPELAEFLREHGDRLTPRDRAFWCLIADVPFRAPSGGGRPSWAG